MKVKIFQTNTTESRMPQLELKINEWLENEKPKIIQILQTDTRASTGMRVSDYYLTITFLYDQEG